MSGWRESTVRTLRIKSGTYNLQLVKNFIVENLTFFNCLNMNYALRQNRISNALFISRSAFHL